MSFTHWVVQNIELLRDLVLMPLIVLVMVAQQFLHAYEKVQQHRLQAQIATHAIDAAQEELRGVRSSLDQAGERLEEATKRQHEILSALLARVQAAPLAEGKRITQALGAVAQELSRISMRSDEASAVIPECEKSASRRVSRRERDIAQQMEVERADFRRTQAAEMPDDSLDRARRSGSA